MSNVMILCERHLIKSTHPFYDECDKLTFLAKNLYNATLYNQLIDMSDDEFEKLSSANSKFELTKEEKSKYKHVTKTIDKVTKNKTK